MKKYVKPTTMKKAIRASKFENQVWLVDRDGNPVTKLMPDGYGYYKVESINAVHFAPGDVYYVKEFESEID